MTIAKIKKQLSIVNSLYGEINALIDNAYDVLETWEQIKPVEQEADAAASIVYDYLEITNTMNKAKEIKSELALKIIESSRQFAKNNNKSIATLTEKQYAVINYTLNYSKIGYTDNFMITMTSNNRFYYTELKPLETVIKTLTEIKAKAEKLTA